MSFKSFNDVIDFAIEREKEAVQFYKDLQDIAKFSAQVEILNEFEIMEKGHVQILLNIKKKGIVDTEINDISSLSKDDYIVDAKPTPEMTYQDIIITGMKREDKSYSLYSSLQNASRNVELFKAFSILVEEESKHKKFFQTIYDNNIQKDN